MYRVYIIELPFEYTLNLTTTDLILGGALLLFILMLTVKSFFIKVQGGSEGLVNQRVVALGDFLGKGEIFEGQVLCMGERWIARADFPVKKDDCLFVSHSEGLILFLNINKSNLETTK